MRNRMPCFGNNDAKRGKMKANYLGVKTYAHQLFSTKLGNKIIDIWKLEEKPFYEISFKKGNKEEYRIVNITEAQFKTLEHFSAAKGLEAFVQTARQQERRRKDSWQSIYHQTERRTKEEKYKK